MGADRHVRRARRGRNPPRGTEGEEGEREEARPPPHFPWPRRCVPAGRSRPRDSDRDTKAPFIPPGVLLSSVERHRTDADPENAATLGPHITNPDWRDPPPSRCAAPRLTLAARAGAAGSLGFWYPPGSPLRCRHLVRPPRRPPGRSPRRSPSLT